MVSAILLIALNIHVVQCNAGKIEIGFDFDDKQNVEQISVHFHDIHYNVRTIRQEFFQIFR